MGHSKGERVRTDARRRAGGIRGRGEKETRDIRDDATEGRAHGQETKKLRVHPFPADKKGEKVGRVNYTLEGEAIASYDLIALERVRTGGLFSRMIDYFELLLTGWFS